MCLPDTCAAGQNREVVICCAALPSPEILNLSGECCREERGSAGLLEISNRATCLNAAVMEKPKLRRLSVDQELGGLVAAKTLFLSLNYKVSYAVCQTQSLLSFNMKK